MRILTTHVGSLVRPPEFVDFLLKQQNDEPYDPREYDECLKRSVADVVRRQKEAGIDIVSDGEYGKTMSWSRYVLERMSGLEEREDNAVVDAGLFVQVDDAFLTSSYDLMVPPKTLKDYRKWAQVRIEALNHALKGIPEEKSRYHLCWGSWNGPHTNDVAIGDIIDLVLKVKAGGYSLEMGNPRHEHEWQV